MEDGELQGEDRAVGGWLLLALLGALLPWQSTWSSVGCAPGGVCGWVSGINSVYVEPASAGPKSPAFWEWTVFLVAAVLGLASFQMNRFPRVRIPFRHLIGPRFYQAVGIVLLVSSLSVAAATSAYTSSVNSGGGVSSVSFSTGPSIWVWTGIIAAVALCRGGYLFKGDWRESRYLKHLLFDPTLS